MNSEEIGGIFMFCTNRGNMTLGGMDRDREADLQRQDPKDRPSYYVVCDCDGVYL